MSALNFFGLVGSFVSFIAGIVLMAVGDVRERNFASWFSSISFFVFVLIALVNY